MKNAGAQAEGIPCDASDFEQVKALASFALSKFGRFDVWVNNAGISAPYGPTVLISPDEFMRVTQVNVFGAYYGSLVAVRYFLNRQGKFQQGKLINILGRGDREPVPMQIPYAASKAWIRNFTLALAKEHQADSVGVFAFNPGMMTTELVQDAPVIAGYEERLKPLGTVLRLLATSPQVPAERMVWLASAATDGKTGLFIH